MALCSENDRRFGDGERTGNISRREWLAAAAGAAALVAARARVVKAQADADSAVDLQRHPWIDAHSHIWTHDVERYPLANGHTVEDLKPPFTERELLDVAHANGVGRVVLIHHHPFYGWDHSYLIDVAQRLPQTFRVVGTVDHLAPNPGEAMRRLVSRRVTGFRITPTLHNERWLAGGMDAMWETAADTGQKICCLINPQDMPAIDAMCQRHPATPVVIDHFARIGADGQIRQQDVDYLCRMARHRHVDVKISAYYALGRKAPPYTDLIPMIRQLLDAYGPERLMWASDAPYQLGEGHSYEASLELVRDRMDFLSEGDRQWLLRKTAERVFFFDA